MEERRDIIKKALAAGILFILILTAVAVVLRYNEEGEENMPFEISKILIVSTAIGDETNISITDTEYEVIQNNGIHIDIKKNDNYQKEAIIKSVEISNIKFIKEPQKGKLNIYIPNTTENKKFTYSDDFILDADSLEYKGASKNDTTSLEINNQGGMLMFAIGNKELGKYELTQDNEVTLDGTMLKGIDVSKEELEFTVNFDIIINTESNSFKSNITLELPVGNLIEDGTGSIEITDTDKYVFKRIWTKRDVYFWFICPVWFIFWTKSKRPFWFIKNILL